MASLRPHPEGVEALFKFMTTNWDEICRRHPPDLSMLSGLVNIMTTGLATAAQLAELEEFFSQKNNAGYDQSLEQSKDVIRSKVLWLERDRDDVAQWLKSNNY